MDFNTLQVDKEVTAHGYVLRYNDAKHKYWITTPSGDNFVVYGMTTVQKPIGSISFDKKTGAVSSKSDTLMAWAVSEVKKALLAGEPIETAVRAHTRKSDYSKDFGHTVHSIIEVASEDKNYQWLDTPEHKVARLIYDNDCQTGTQILAQELLVFMPSNPQDPADQWTDWIAGTFDRLVMRGGSVELQDHKTSSGVYDLNYYVQLMGYQQMLEWMMTDSRNTYHDTLDMLRHTPITKRRVNLATKLGRFTDEWVSTNDLDDFKMFKATLDIFNTSKKYKHLFWEK